MKLYFENYFDESSNSRLVKRFQDESSFAIISAYRINYSEDENRQRQKRLKGEIRKLGFGFNEFVSAWQEDGETSYERALLIPNIPFDEALKLGNIFDQYSIIYKDDSGCKEYVSSDKYGKSIGTEIQKFNTSGNFMNIEMAKKIFARKMNGAASKAIKGSNPQPFSLTSEQFELFEVLEARPSYFNTNERLVKINL